jgi:hypothetical protein
MHADMNAVKWVPAIGPQARVDGATATATEIDTLGFARCDIAVQVGELDAALTALKIQESDTSGSGFADVTGLIVGTSAGIDGTTSELPAVADADSINLFQVNLTGARKRYLKVVATAPATSDGAFLSAVACLSRKAEGPSLISESAVGADNCLRV